MKARSGQATLGKAPALGGSRTWLRPFRPGRDGAFDEAAVLHLLRRAAFGNPPSEVERMLRLGPEGAARALVAGSEPDRAAQSLEDMRPFVLGTESGRDLAAFWFARLCRTRHPLRMRMTLFWHDHFATSIRKVRNAWWMTEQFETFEGLGLGPFPDLCRAVVKGPAMLRWLDAPSNRKGRPNENLGRELLELFTLGRGNYGERDVKEAARALTGWTIIKGRFRFDRRRHDPGVKEVCGKQGKWDGDALCTHLFSLESCARFLAGKLLEHFVGPRWPVEARTELAEVLRERGLHIGEALEVLLASRLFHRPEFRGARLRGPIEWQAWVLRSLGARASPAALHRSAGRMGQRLLDPPDVAGWPEGEAWLSSASWLQRADFALCLGRPGGPFHLDPPLEELVPDRGPEAECGFLIRALLPEGLPRRAEEILKARARAEARLPRPVRLAGLLGALLLVPAAHRC